MDDVQRRAWVYERLVWALRWLAAEPEAALVAVPSWIPPDWEMAEPLADILPALEALDAVDQRVLDAVKEIDQAFEPMARQDDLWSNDAIRTHDLWARQRERARAVLSTMGEERADDQLLGNV